MRPSPHPQPASSITVHLFCVQMASSRSKMLSAVRYLSDCLSHLSLHIKELSLCRINIQCPAWQQCVSLPLDRQCQPTASFPPPVTYMRSQEVGWFMLTRVGSSHSMAMTMGVLKKHKTYRITEPFTGLMTPTFITGHSVGGLEMILHESVLTGCR